MSQRSRMLAIALCLSGCAPSLDKFVASMVPDSELTTAEEAIRLTQAGAFEEVSGSFHSSVPADQRGNDELWQELSSRLRGLDLDALQMIAVNVAVTQDGRSSVLAYEGASDAGWVNVTVRLRDGVLFGLNIVPMEGSLVSANTFRLRDIGPSHVALLLYGLGTIGLAAFASYRVLGSRIKRRRLWAVLPFVMVGQASLVWPTGVLGLQLLRLHIPPVTLLKAGPAAPWVVGFGIPLFAIIALRKVSKANSEEEGLGDRVTGRGERG